MKISTYYKNLGGWDVVFFKGDLKLFVIESIADKCIADFCFIDDSYNWYLKRDEIIEYIRTRKSSAIDNISIEQSDMKIILLGKIKEWKDYYWNGEWKNNPEWDRVHITTLFTFYWNITIDTINFAKYLVKDIKD